MRMNTGNLLLVDDNEFNVDFLARRLQRQGYGVTKASNGQMALDLLDKQQFDIMLLDIEMPIMSGLDVLEKTRSQYKASELPVIMVTAQHEGSSIVQALDLGANDYVTKP